MRTQSAWLLKASTGDIDSGLFPTFPSFEVAGYVFSPIDVGEQLIEPRSCTSQGLSIGIRGSLQHFIEAGRCRLELLEFVVGDLLPACLFARLNQARDSFPDIDCLVLLVFVTHGLTGINKTRKTDCQLCYGEIPAKDITRTAFNSDTEVLVTSQVRRA
jgi:hypothetical protein